MQVITKQSNTEIKITEAIPNSTIWSKDALLAEKNSLEGKLSIVNNLLGECDKNEVKSSQEIAEAIALENPVEEPLEILMEK